MLLSAIGLLIADIQVILKVYTVNFYIFFSLKFLWFLLKFMKLKIRYFLNHTSEPMYIAIAYI